jgi:uncharacterized protein YydD (DUF2326 family)
MLRIDRLYTDPMTIDPIEFKEGLNIILGERDETSDKRNGVGKSLCIEFLNFAFLKSKSHSRVSQIPKEIFSPETFICVDFKLHDQTCTIKRSLKNSENPTLIENGKETVFEKIEDANKYLTEKLFGDFKVAYPNFRMMLGPLIRDERSEFKSLISCYDTKLRIADNYSPHLFLLGIDITVYDLIKQHIDSIEEIQADIKRIVENVRLIRQKEIEDARSDLNELDNEVQSIEASIDKLENISGYEVIKTEILKLEEDIDARRRKKGILKQQILKLKAVSQKVDIEPGEIIEFYESLKQGLGDLIGKSLEEAISFKEKIDEFQNKLISERRNSLQKQVSGLEEEIEALDRQYTKSLGVLNQKGDLKNLKQTYAAFTEKSDQLSQLRGFVDRFDQLEIKKQVAKTEKEKELLRLQSLIQEQKRVIELIEKTILNIHEYIQGNRQASFVVKHTTNKLIVDIILRIADDGSHSVEREKVFIYDIALLLNEQTGVRHPGFLVHDNIFDVDNDTLKKSLSFLKEKASFGQKQYILTINSDRLPANSANFEDSYDGFVRARYTKGYRFLKTKYQETKS